MESHCSTCICGRRAPVQATLDGAHKKGPGTITWEEHLTLWSEYARRYGKSQSADRLAERGGFSYGEICEMMGYAPLTWQPR